MKITISGIQALVTNQVVEQAVEDRGKNVRLVTLKKSVHVVNYVVNYSLWCKPIATMSYATISPHDLCRSM